MLIKPDWLAPPCVKAFMTTRMGGVSESAFGDALGQNGLNPALHVGDDADCVQRNRALIHQYLPQPALWLNQTHSTLVYEPDDMPYDALNPPNADAVVLTQAGLVGVVMTADCLPVLLASADGSVVGAAHAGWRGLLDGVIEQTVAAMVARGAGASLLHVWLGAAIGPSAFEVGHEVRELFITQNPSADVAACFQPHPVHAHKLLADIYGLARERLLSCGVLNISGGDACTVTDEQRFYSYRRDGQTGRMASLIWRSAD